MGVEKDLSKIKYLYHYTLKENVDSIMSSMEIHSTDQYIFFTDSLDKSIGLFERDMMTDSWYIDLDCKLKRRTPARKEDYRIIKIAYRNDGNFYKFIFPGNNDKNNVYNVSKIHKGTLHFEKAEVLEFPKEEINSINIFKYNFVTKLASLAFLLAPLSVKADTWLENNNYDISWFDSSTYDSTESYSISSASKIAGLIYLSRNGYSFENKTITITAPNDAYIYMTDHDWVPFPSTFKGRINTTYYIEAPGSHGHAHVCGIHRIIIMALDNSNPPFKEDNVCTYYYYPISYVASGFTYKEDTCNALFKYDSYYTISIANTEHGHISVDEDIVKASTTSLIRVFPDTGYKLESIYSSTPDGQRVQINPSNYNYYITVTNQPVVLSATFREIVPVLNVHDIDHSTHTVTKIDNHNYDIIVTPDAGYEIEGYYINSGDLIPTDSNTIEIRNIQQDTDVWIQVKPTQYEIINAEDFAEFDVNKNNSLTVKTNGGHNVFSQIMICDQTGLCKALLKKDFTIASDNTYVIKKEYLSDLQSGEYRIKINYTTGVTAEAPLGLINNPNSDQTTSDNDETSSDSENQNIVNPKTGAFVSAGVLILFVSSFVYIRIRKKNYL